MSGIFNCEEPTLVQQCTCDNMSTFDIIGKTSNEISLKVLVICFYLQVLCFVKMFRTLTVVVQVRIHTFECHVQSHAELE